MLRAMWYNFNSPFNVEDTGVIDCVENNFALVVEFIEIDVQLLSIHCQDWSVNCQWNGYSPVVCSVVVGDAFVVNVASKWKRWLRTGVRHLN